MLGMLKIFGRLGGVLALIFLIVALLRQLITLVGFLLAAVKIAIVLVFVCVLVLIVVAILRDRSTAGYTEPWSGAASRLGSEGQRLHQRTPSPGRGAATPSGVSQAA